tara:strand:+ start:163 stop:795 length:633 start_codon:yes stop_codon:yes gene_type:complete
MVNNKKTLKKYNKSKRKKNRTSNKKSKKIQFRTFRKNNKGKGLKKFLKSLYTRKRKREKPATPLEQQILLSKLNTHLPQDIKSKISKTKKEECEENNIKILKNLKPLKEVINDLLEEYPYQREFIDIKNRIEEIEKDKLINFSNEKIKDTKKKVNEILEDVLYNLDIGISNEIMAQSEIEGYRSDNLDTYINLKKDLLINIQDYYPLGEY